MSVRILPLVLVSFWVFSFTVPVVDAREPWTLIPIDGVLQVVGNKTVCNCPNSAATCTCLLFGSATRGAVREISYDDLATLDSFDGEDEEFLYFKVATREDTEPPVFDLSVRGDALVKISKQHLKEYLLSEE